MEHQVGKAYYCGILFFTALLSSAAAAEHPAAIYGDLPDAKHAWAVHDWNRPKPSRVAVDAKGVPSDAIVLFDGSQESFDRNWRTEKRTRAWKVEDGAMKVTPVRKNGASVMTRREFGDCQLHIEFRHPASLAGDTERYPQSRGNSGVFLMGPRYGYEVQVLESYPTCAEMEGKPGYVNNYTDGQCGSVYAENPPLVNPLRPAGEWQKYDIVFHQPVWKDGKLVHPGSITVFLNGVLVQDHWEMEGQTTHLKRRPLAPHPKTGPLTLQYHGCEVSFRNIWIRPLASRWDNKTHSSMSADEASVAKLRRETAAKLYAKIKNPDAGDAATVKALAEVVSYSNESVYVDKLRSAAKKFYSSGPREADKRSVGNDLDALVRSGAVPDGIGR